MRAGHASASDCSCRFDAGFYLPASIGNRVLKLTKEIARLEDLVAKHQRRLGELRAERHELLP